MPKLKYLISSLAIKAGFTVAMKSDSNAVKSLLETLWPVKIDTEFIRLGIDGDGGYALPNDLDGIKACFSPGVDDRATFEMELINRGIPCYMADATVDVNPVDHKDGHFIKKFLGVVNDDVFITADSWIDENEPGDDDLLLQMDIEGAEWTTLLNISERNLKRFRIILLELHDMERLMDKHAFQIMSAVFSRLTEHFHVVHNHPNNYGGKVDTGEFEIPRALEMTLIRKDRAEAKGYATQFPHPLDQINAPHLPDVILPKYWRAD